MSFFVCLKMTGKDGYWYPRMWRGLSYQQSVSDRLSAFKQLKLFKKVLHSIVFYQGWLRINKEVKSQLVRVYFTFHCFWRRSDFVTRRSSIRNGGPRLINEHVLTCVTWLKAKNFQNIVSEYATFSSFSGICPLRLTRNKCFEPYNFHVSFPNQGVSFPISGCLGTEFASGTENC